MVKRIFESDSSTVTATSGSSTSFCNSPTVLRGMMMPGICSEPFGAGVSQRASRWPSVATARSTMSLSPSAVCTIDAVQVVARLFGRDRELRAVDQVSSKGRNRAGRYG
jgi:hypothetical protein